MRRTRRGSGSRSAPASPPSATPRRSRLSPAPASFRKRRWPRPASQRRRRKESSCLAGPTSRESPVSAGGGTVADGEFHDQGGVSRRKVIKRAAAGAAVVWATPVLTSMATPAHAAGTPKPCGTCGDDLCGTVSEPCGESSFPGIPCLCAQKTDRTCACFQPVCDVGDACGNDSHCPPGFACVNPGCCGSTICAPLCGTAIQPPPGGRRAPTRPWAPV